MYDETMLPDPVRMGVFQLARSADDSQRRFMKQLAERQREPNRGETSVEDAEEFFRDRQDAVNFLKQLGEAGCGNFFTGRRGRPTRIEWATCGAIPVAKTFLQAADQVPAADVSGLTTGTAPSPLPSTQTLPAKLHPHTFLLRPELTLTLQLPLNLTKEEANRLADFIRALPF